jgi:diguanylate cyclase (GGDEF)-like protein
VDGVSENPDLTPTGRIDINEWAYLGARFFLVAALGALYAFGVMSAAPANDQTMYLAGTALLVVDTVALFGVAFVGRSGVSAAMMPIIMPDLAVFALFTYLGRPNDSFYPVIFAGPVLYALCVPKRQALIVGAGTALAYGVGLLFIGPLTAAEIALYALKLVTVPVMGYFVANAVSWQREREMTAEHEAAETERLNLQLRKRVHELQAVSEITEIIHSSLDFDSIGPRVLEIVGTAIGVKTCCLFVIDKERSETLFTATRGMQTHLGVAEEGMTFAEIDAEHLTCVPVFDHGRTMVLFCTTSEDLNRFSDEERLMLGAVSSELVVAVENSRLYKLTRRLSVTDELTGLANYRQLQQRIDEEIARAQRYDKHLSLLMLDADDFKAFNDAHGHVAGDRALSEIGPIMRGAVREVDLAARYGGEEFAILLPETDAQGAYVVAEKIREAVELHRFEGTDGRREYSITISVGFATYPTHASDKDSLLRLADDALYHAKGSGKNRVRPPQRHSEEAREPTEIESPLADEWTGA